MKNNCILNITVFSFPRSFLNSYLIFTSKSVNTFKNGPQRPAVKRSLSTLKYSQSHHSKRICFFLPKCKICVKDGSAGAKWWDECVIFRQPIQSAVSSTDTWAGGQWRRHIVNGGHEVTWFLGICPDVSWHRQNREQGWAKWGRRNTYSQFPQIYGRSGLSRSRRRQRHTVMSIKHHYCNSLKRKGNIFSWRKLKGLKCRNND